MVSLKEFCKITAKKDTTQLPERDEYVYCKWKYSQSLAPAVSTSRCLTETHLYLKIQLISQSKKSSKLWHISQKTHMLVCSYLEALLYCKVEQKCHMKLDCKNEDV